MKFTDYIMKLRLTNFTNFSNNKNNYMQIDDYKCEHLLIGVRSNLNTLPSYTEECGAIVYKKLLIILFLTVFVLVGTSDVFSQQQQNSILLGEKYSKEYCENRLQKSENEFFQKFIANRILNKKFDITADVLDSVFVTNSDGSFLNHKFTYDLVENRVTQISTKKDSSGWENVTRESFIYNSNSSLKSATTETWDGTDWVNNSRYSYTRNDSNKILLYLYEIWKDAKWTNQSKYTNTYSSEGKLYLSSKWDGTNWIDNSRGTTTYDENGNKVSYLSERWDDSNWVGYWREYYSYNANANMDSLTYQFWNVDKWGVPSLYTMAYDTNGNEILRLLYHKNDSSWAISTRDTSIYNSDGNKISQIKEQWQDNASIWLKLTKNTYTYDSNGNIILHLIETGQNTGHWNNWNLLTYTYNTEGYIISYLNKKWNDASWELNTWGYLRLDDPLEREFSFRGPKIELSYKTITDIEEDRQIALNFKLLQNYPNPFNPTTTISYVLSNSGFVQLKLYDMLGSEVAVLVNKEQLPGNYKVEFNAPNLSSGIYFYKLQSGNFSMTKKLILLK